MSMVFVVVTTDQENVDDEEDSVMAIFLNKEDADEFANSLIKAGRSAVYVDPRVLYTGQPPRIGWNP
jgi:hypothetical protein